MSITINDMPEGWYYSFDDVQLAEKVVSLIYANPDVGNIPREDLAEMLIPGSVKLVTEWPFHESFLDYMFMQTVLEGLRSNTIADEHTPLHDFVQAVCILLAFSASEEPYEAADWLREYVIPRTLDETLEAMVQLDEFQAHLGIPVGERQSSEEIWEDFRRQLPS